MERLQAEIGLEIRFFLWFYAEYHIIKLVCYRHIRIMPVDVVLFIKKMLIKHRLLR